MNSSKLGFLSLMLAIGIVFGMVLHRWSPSPLPTREPSQPAAVTPPKAPVVVPLTTNNLAAAFEPLQRETNFADFSDGLGRLIERLGPETFAPAVEIARALESDPQRVTAKTRIVEQ